MELRVESMGRPKWVKKPAVDFQVHHLWLGDSELCVVTTYENGHRVFEFDNKRRYTAEEVETVLRVGKEVTA